MITNLVFKEKDLDIIASTLVPPLVYTLPEGKLRNSVTYPERVGRWKLIWVNTNGKKDKGSLMLVPMCGNDKRKVFNTRVQYYMSFGFKEFEATLLAKMDVTKYWCRNNIRFLYGLATNAFGLESLEDLRTALPELATTSKISNTDAIRNYLLLEQLRSKVMGISPDVC